MDQLPILVWCIVGPCLWLLSSVAGYLLLRTAWKHDFNGKWTVGDRRPFICFAIIFGPVGTVVGVIIFFLTIEFFPKDDTPANW